MNPILLLRIAAVVALLQFAAHTLLLVFSSPQHGPQEIALVEAKRSQRFGFLGATRSYWNFYFSYGLFAAFTCLIEAVLFWQLTTFASAGAVPIRPIAALFCLANVGYAILAWKYFFISPIIPDVALALCLGPRVPDRGRLT